MTKQQLIKYLRVCADLADAPKDGVAHVAIVPLRQAIQLLESPAEPKHVPFLEEAAEISKEAWNALEPPVHVMHGTAITFSFDPKDGLVTLTRDCGDSYSRFALSVPDMQRLCEWFGLATEVTLKS